MSKNGLCRKSTVDLAAESQSRRSWISGTLLCILLLAALLLALWRDRRSRRLEWTPRAPQQEEVAFDLAVAASQYSGLSETEIEARRSQGQDNVVTFETLRSRRQIWNDSLFTVFNYNLVGLTVSLWLLGKPWDAITTAVVMLASILLDVVQQLQAKERLDQLLTQTRSEATVIREATVHRVDPGEIVLGDVVVVGPGDEIFADGQLMTDGRIVVDESILDARSGPLTKQAGDPIYAGSYCIAGRGVYEAQKVGTAREVEKFTTRTDASQLELTPLQSFIRRLLQILLVIVVVASISLLIDHFIFSDGLFPQLYNDVVGMVFGIAPTGLFLMLLVAYTVATADIADLGALVRRTQSVESLANVTVLCFGQSGVLKGAHVRLEFEDLPIGREGLSETRIRQVLGDYVHSSSDRNLVTSLLVDAFDGQRRPIEAEMPMWSVYGWSSVTFNQVDLRGTFVLGDPEIVKLSLVADTLPEPPPEDTEDESRTRIFAGRLLSPLGRFFKPGVEDSDESNNAALVGPQVEAPGKQSGFLSRLLIRVKPILDRSDPSVEEQALGAPEPEGFDLLFAFRPDLVPLHDTNREPHLPSDLIPLGSLNISERMRPEAIEAVQSFSAAGVQVKVLSADGPVAVANTARRVGLAQEDGTPLDGVSGTDLAAADEDQFSRTVAENVVFGFLSPEQKAKVVRVLHQLGHRVAMVGGNVSDVPALKQADLGIAMGSGSQASLSVADIVLLDDSLMVLPQMLNSGQRIVNVLLDVLKINLTQVFYLALLLAAAFVLSLDLPYAPKHSTFIVLFTVSVPVIGLTLWAGAGAIPTEYMQRRLVHFVVPASLTMAAVALVVHLGFREATQDTAYAQLGTAVILTVCGLLLILFVRPPTKAWVGGGLLSGDWRPAWLVIVLLVLFFVIALIPLAQQVLNVEPLRQWSNYVVIGLVAAGWALVLRSLWRSRLSAWLFRADIDAACNEPAYSRGGPSTGGRDWG